MVNSENATMLKIALNRFVLLVIAVSSLMASSARAQYFSNYDQNKDIFIRNVKLIDEFIERFNDDKATYLRRSLPGGDTQSNITRGMLLASLFDLENTSFTDKDTLLKGFFRTILDKQHPVYLAFNDTDWFARAQCVFLENGRLVELPIILRVRSNHEGARWTIAGVGTSTLSKGVRPSVTVAEGGKMPGYIATSAYATNFVDLHYVFTKKIEPAHVFEEEYLTSAKGSDFVNAVKNGSIRFQYVKKITFYFFHVNGCMFTVDHFKRQSYNCGWLISNVNKLPDMGKSAAIKTFLSAAGLP